MVGGFEDLEALASPTEFGAMLVESPIPDSNLDVAKRILHLVRDLPDDCSPHLWRVPTTT
ncbi:hypothetical protein GF402_05615 [Candidatus Fermentibacteria bacterium]|nr:hypothetical protein [Candidatus Fermentibacteria bacterium]